MAKKLAQKNKRLRLLAIPAHSFSCTPLLIAAAEASGTILGFLDVRALPITEAWLEELVSVLCREDIGCVAGKLISQEHLTLHAGYHIDAEGLLRPILPGLPCADFGYLGYNRLAHSVDALDALCLFTLRETFHATNGFDESMHEAAAQDFCLRLGEIGLRSVWWPYVEFYLSKTTILPDLTSNAPFTQRWHKRAKPSLPNLIIDEQGFSLANC